MRLSREHLYDIRVCDRRATKSQGPRSVARNVKCDSWSSASSAGSDNPAWLRRGKQTGPKRLERTWICGQIQGGPDFSPSATRVTGELLIADMRHGASGGLAQHDHSGLFSLKEAPPMATDTSIPQNPDKDVNANHHNDAESYAIPIGPSQRHGSSGTGSSCAY